MKATPVLPWAGKDALLALLLYAPTGQTKVAQGNALGMGCAKVDEP